MTDLDDDLKATAQSIIADTDRITDIEQEKLKLDPGDERVVALADEAEEVANRLLQEAGVERELAQQAADAAAGRGQDTQRPSR
jgi:pimeloyl-CoA synthetase